jgi:hypothetical protein
MPYDPTLLNDLANKLQTGTKRVVLIFTVMGALMGAAVGSYIYMATTTESKLQVALWTVMLAVFGWVVGRERAFTMSVRAQEILCQLRIEENTRAKAAGASAN